MPAEALPLELQAGMNQILIGAMTFLVDLKEVEDEGEVEDPASDPEDDQDQGDEEEEEVEDGEEEELAGEDLTRALKQQQAREMRFGGNDEDSDSDDDWGQMDDDAETALDNIDAHIIFGDTMTAISANDSLRFQALTSALDFQQQSMLHSLMNVAEQKRQLAAQKTVDGANS
eukprot:CAMPEP_0196574476 /NCGR_PEP_ID=MMETSP1081-20130531/4181_1 /TAXON_ID=36882 /ORGANISM="Pyramimonas amylifera, Strain CCMP720" /LENGTH=172 /DNA_ID=CAMNT_0041892505 /DNA_START=189 /DNA_END=707 /DNA_ORIENTATION=-